MNDSTLLIPDSGPDFVRTLKQAILYSDTVHTFAIADPEVSRTLAGPLSLNRLAFRALLAKSDLESVSEQIANNLVPKRGTEDSAVRQVIHKTMEALASNSPGETFLRPPAEESELLTLARKENVLFSVSEMAFHKLKKDTKVVVEPVGRVLMKLIEEAKTELEGWAASGKIDAYVNDAHPSMFSVIEEFFVLALEYGIEQRRIPEPDSELMDRLDGVLRYGAFAVYMCLASYYVLTNDMPAVTWQPMMQEFYEDCTNAVKRGLPALNELVRQRQDVTRRLGQLVLKESVPNVTDLPLEEVLEIRRKRAPELQKFRDGLRQLSADVDPELSGDRLELELDTKIQKVFKPAMKDVRDSVKELQYDAWNRVLQPTKELLAALIPAAISLSANAPIQTTVGVAASSAIIVKLCESLIGYKTETQKVLNRSHWSILFDLEKRGKKQA